MINDSEYKIKQNISKLSKQIQKKFLDMRKGRLDEAEFLKRSYEPIVQPVREILSKLNVDGMTTAPLGFSTPLKTGIKTDDESFREKYETPTQLQDSSTDSQKMMESYDDDTYQEYIKKYNNKSDEIDYEYGLKLIDPTSNKWRLGKIDVTIKNYDFILGDDERYPATIGLYELFFMKHPDGSHITAEDKKNYRAIVKKARLFNEGPDKKNVFKYKTYIMPTTTMTPKRRSSYQLRTKAKKGEGLTKNLDVRRKKEFVYYDNYNELVERLQLLVGAQLAGNNSVNNEIISIIEELREANIIE